MRLTRIVFGLLFFCWMAPAAARIIPGADRVDTLVTLTRGKRVGLIVNQTSRLSDGKTHLLDALLAAGVDVRCIFAPEHGFRGDADAGAVIADERDARTGLPVVSLYGKNKKPTPEQLRDVDLLVFDIQDVGARFYTYISTLYYALQACGEQGKAMIVLDRPNPNDFVDGPVLKEARYRSFVGALPLPLLHGLTVAELARMIVGEGWAGAPGPALQVVPVRGWRHGESYSLPVSPSPNLPDDRAVRLYPSLCLFEATDVSVGRGTPWPFQIIGYPDPTFGSFSFVPRSLKGSDLNPLQKGKRCYGLDLRNEPFDGGFTLRYLLDFHRKAGSALISRPRWFDLLAGNSELRTQIESGKSEAEIRRTWQSDLDAYRAIRAKYLLYPETK